MAFLRCPDHSKEALEMARIQETTKQIEQQRKIKVRGEMHKEKKSLCFIRKQGGRLSSGWVFTITEVLSSVQHGI